MWTLRTAGGVPQGFPLYNKLLQQFTTNCYNSLIAVTEPVTEPLRYYVHVGDHIGRRSGGSRLRRIRGKRARNADGDDRSAGERAAEWQKWTR